MTRMGVGPFAHRFERVAQPAAVRPLVDFDDVENLKHAVAVVQIQFDAADAPVQLHVERGVAVIEEFEIATAAWLARDSCCACR